MRIFETKENGPIYIHNDDFQVLSHVMLSWKAYMEAVDEMNKRQMAQAVQQIDPVSKDLIDYYRRERQWHKVASVCYDKFLKLIQSGKTEDI